MLLQRVQFLCQLCSEQQECPRGRCVYMGLFVGCFTSCCRWNTDLHWTTCLVVFKQAEVLFSFKQFIWSYLYEHSTFGAWNLLPRCSWSIKVDMSVASGSIEGVDVSKIRATHFNGKNFPTELGLRKIVPHTTCWCLLCNLLLSEGLNQDCRRELLSSWILLCFHHTWLWFG